jgi:hypothetical protein
MATVKEHYDNHLGSFYSWMMGDLAGKQAEFQNFLIEHELLPLITKNAIDLGAAADSNNILEAYIGAVCRGKPGIAKIRCQRIRYYKNKESRSISWMKWMNIIIRCVC